MSVVTLIYAVLFYLAVACLVGGIARKIYIYASTPQPLRIPTTPAPTTRLGVAARMLREVTIFESLFKANKWIWLFGWVFHFALLIVLLAHLRHFVEPVWAWVMWLQPWGLYAGVGMLFGLLGLWARRVLVDRVRYITNPSDHLMLALLTAIATSGLLLKYRMPTDIFAVKTFFRGLATLDWQPLPNHPLLLVHLALVAMLMIVFPWSKLLHAPGVFFSPTRNQADNARERRHTSGRSATTGGKR